MEQAFSVSCFPFASGTACVKLCTVYTKEGGGAFVRLVITWKVDAGVTSVRRGERVGDSGSVSGALAAKALDSVSSGTCTCSAALAARGLSSFLGGDPGRGRPAASRRAPVGAGSTLPLLLSSLLCR